MVAPFNPAKPLCFLQGRKGIVYAYQGWTAKGQAYQVVGNAWRDVGVVAPTAAASMSVSGDLEYYVARTDILDAGGVYDKPPIVTFSASPGVTATAIARLTEDRLRIIEMTNYGRGYTTPPTVSLTAPTAAVAGTEILVYPVVSQNNWAPGTADNILISAGIALTISGLAAAANGTIVNLVNVGNNAITFMRESASSSAANRFSLPGFVNRYVAPGSQVGFTYRTSVNRWVQTTGGSADRGLPTTSTAIPIVRTHLRGKYQCYYRYVNPLVLENDGGPLYSNLSPVLEVDCGNGSKQMTWTYASPPAGQYAELWRTTSNQATTLFRVARITSGFAPYVDSLTDWELIDPNRGSGNTGYQAMPILLPNGELNANRFGVPPTSYSIAIMFQDRQWMAGDTAGGNPNTLRFSEGDEPESMPDVNELLLQSNLRSSDFITAMVPYAGMILVMQHCHCHRLSYVSQPLIDAAIFLMAYRGCLNQRCWDIFEGRVYAMDSQGVYSIDPQGNVENLSLGLWDIFRDKIDFSLAAWFTVRADKTNAVLRVCVAYTADGSSKAPTRMLVYSFDYKTWWEERYPVELMCATEATMGDGCGELVYGTSEGKLFILDKGEVDVGYGSIEATTLTNAGRGYTKPPTITAAGGHGAEFECAIDTNGSITGIVRKQPGTQYSNGSLTISAPETTGGTQATATYVIGTPGEEQGIHWSYRSGAFEFTTDEQSKKGAEEQTRQCSVTYQPTITACDLNLKTFYNNATYPRSNVARRDRGAGFVHSGIVPAAVLDMQATPLQEAEAHGVAKAIFSGRAMSDMLGSDRHVSVALSGVRTVAGPVVIHQLDVYGVNQEGG